MKEVIYHQDHIADLLPLLLQVIQDHPDPNREAIQAEVLLHTHQEDHHSRQDLHQEAVLTAHRVVLRRAEDKLRSGNV